MTSNSPGIGRVFTRRVLAHLRLAGASSRPTRGQADDDRSVQIHPPPAV